MAACLIMRQDMGLMDHVCAWGGDERPAGDGKREGMGSGYGGSGLLAQQSCLMRTFGVRFARKGPKTAGT